MRPLQLTMQAFGPFAAEQKLDFRGLGANSLFLVWGPTGSGKTSIMDAICFALFGESSGHLREPSQLRSQLAAVDVLTQVIFDFSVGTNSYRVTRSPEQDRPAKRGGGTTADPHKAEFHCLEIDGSEGRVLAARPSDVNAKIETLLGFSAEQFRQVVVLPQGRFQEFLFAQDKEREEILEILFRTDFYRRVEEQLKENAKGLKTAFEKSRAAVEATLKPFGVTDRPGLLESMERARENEYAAEVTRAEAHASFEKARKAFEEGRQCAKGFAELSAAEAVLKDVEANRKAHEKNVVNYRRAQVAVPLVPVMNARDSAKVEATEARERHGKLVSDLSDARDALRQAVKILKLEDAKDSIRRAAVKRIDVLERLVERLGPLENSRANVVKTKTEYNDAVVNTTELETKRKELSGKLEQTRTELEALKLKARNAEAKALLEESTAAALNAKEKSEELVAELKRADQALKDAMRQAERVKSEQERIQKAAERKEQSWREGQASRLALTLKVHQPCPVCGSKEHPHPARSEATIPSDAEMDQIREGVRVAQDDNQSARDNLAKAEKAQEVLADKLTHMQGSQGDHLNVTMSALRRRHEELRLQLKEAKDAERAIPTCEARRIDLAKRLTQIERELKSSEHSLGRLRDALRAAEASLKEREGDFPQGLQNPIVLRKALRDARSTDEELKTALEHAQKEERAAQKLFEGTQSTCEAAAARVKRAEAVAAKAVARFEKDLQDAGFLREGDFVQARLSPTDIKCLESIIKTWEESIHKTEDRMIRAKAAVEGLSRPNLVGLQATFEETQKKHAEANGRAGEIKEQIKGHKTAVEIVTRLEREGTQAEKKYQLVARVADTASGSNVSGISLNRYVLGARLDEVLTQASIRLTTMSRGRFRLSRVNTREDRRRASGLELSVFDEHTGKERSVKTLSGGESFLAALCLALGLSDAVQATTGGVRLESIFVDEGFGTLDPEALDAAVHALEELQRGGRLVGIISHVPELKERIPARLEVTPIQIGSTARFII